MLIKVSKCTPTPTPNRTLTITCHQFIAFGSFEGYVLICSHNFLIKQGLEGGNGS